MSRKAVKAKSFSPTLSIASSLYHCGRTPEGPTSPMKVTLISAGLSGAALFRLEISLGGKVKPGSTEKRTTSSFGLSVRATAFLAGKRVSKR